MSEGAVPCEIFPVAVRASRAACIHVDVDSLWVIGRFHGFETAVAHDPLFHGSIPRFLKLFDELDIRATFFVTGRDASGASASPLLREVIKQGHEIANHSMTHPPNFNSLSREDLRAEIGESTRAIEEVTGRAPVGFRAPTFNVSEDVLDILEDAGYLYDSSVLPAPVSPLFTVVQVLSGRTRFTYGRAAHWRAPLRPYRPSREKPWRRGDRAIWEVPVSVMPLFRIPFHASYVLKSGRWLFDLGFRAYRMTSAPLVYLLHAKDLFDLEGVGGRNPEESVRPSVRKASLIASMLRKIQQYYRTTTTEELIKQTSGRREELS
jgi:hypothetical protein